MENQLTPHQRKQAIIYCCVGLVLVLISCLLAGYVGHGDIFYIYKNVLSILHIGPGVEVNSEINPMFLKNPLAPADSLTIQFVHFAETFTSLALIFVLILAPITIIYHSVRIKKGNKVAHS